MSEYLLKYLMIPSSTSVAVKNICARKKKLQSLWSLWNPKLHGQAIRQAGIGCFKCLSIMPLVNSENGGNDSDHIRI